MSPVRAGSKGEPAITRSLSWQNHLLRWFFKLSFTLLFNVRTTGLDHVPKNGVILVSNHLSWIDHLLLYAVLPPEPRIYLLGAGQSISSPFKAWLVRTFGSVISFERGAGWIGKAALEQPLCVLQAGASLFLFPEGDTGKVEGELMPLKPGVGHLILLANRPILPIALSGVRELYWRKPMRVIIGSPITVNVRGLPRRAAIEAAMEQVRAAMQELLPAYIEPAVGKKRLLFLNRLSDRL